MERKSLEELSDFTRSIFDNSQRDHLLITGSINMGKTSLLQSLLNGLEDYTMIRIYIYGDHKAIKLHDSISGKEWTIGKRASRAMEEVDNFFTLKGPSLLESHLKAPQSIFVMDEVGRLEKNKPEYLKTLEEIFKNKKVIATMRREDNALYGSRFIFDNSIVIDLDTLNCI